MNEVKALEPVDYHYCQADVPTGHSPFTIGPRTAYRRCGAKPSYVVTETQPGADGRQGAMSVCGRCLDVLKKQEGMPEFTLSAIVSKCTVTVEIETLATTQEEATNAIAARLKIGRITGVKTISASKVELGH